jgi:hypothetical protein
MEGDGMKELPFCKFTRTRVNPVYYDCPDKFNCDRCQRLDKKKRQVILPKKKEFPPKVLFEGDEVAYSGPNKLILKPDWLPLEKAVRKYRLYTQDAEIDGVKAFWEKWESLCNWKEGSWEYLSKEEKHLVAKAREGSVRAIQRLVVLNPRMIRLPFVIDFLERIIRTVKYEKGEKLREAQGQWKGFLPTRESHKNITPNHVLKHLLKSTMAEKSITKGKAIKHLLKAFPDINRRQWEGVRIR